jgi:hypothetical protein
MRDCNLAKGALLLTLWLVSPLLPNCRGAEIPDTYSKPVQELFKEAQATSSRLIILKAIPSKPLQPLQGHTNGDPDRIEITITAGVSRDYDDAVLAHELLHVILNNKGFTAGGVTLPSKAGPRAPEIEGALDTMVDVLNSCFSDELIDREMVKRGLKPGLLLDRQIEGTIQGASAYEKDEGESWPNTVKNGQAVILFCLAKRIPEKTMLRVEAKLQPAFGRTVMDREKDLVSRFKGRICDIGKPEACYQLTVQLRNEAGLKD